MQAIEAHGVSCLCQTLATEVSTVSVDNSAWAEFLFDQAPWRPQKLREGGPLGAVQVGAG